MMLRGRSFLFSVSEIVSNRCSLSILAQLVSFCMMMWDEEVLLCCADGDGTSDECVLRAILNLFYGASSLAESSTCPAVSPTLPLLSFAGRESLFVDC